MVPTQSATSSAQFLRDTPVAHLQPLFDFVDTLVSTETSRIWSKTSTFAQTTSHQLSANNQALYNNDWKVCLGSAVRTLSVGAADLLDQLSDAVAPIDEASAITNLIFLKNQFVGTFRLYAELSHVAFGESVDAEAVGDLLTSWCNVSMRADYEFMTSVWAQHIATYALQYPYDFQLYQITDSPTSPS
jgi:hypothetical protein